ncbi:MAG: hypothetical protein JNJ54_25170 [Myxococcaceae bacterium]|nr:hypothetical protein [Myxococcaceae bacterium]
MHLDDATWQRLWKDPASSGPMLEHLKEGCEVCDGWIAARPELDGEVDRLLLALSPREAPLDEMGWRRLRARLGRERRSLAALIALAAGLLVLVGASLSVRSMLRVPTDDGVKGSGRVLMSVIAARQLPSGDFEQVPPNGRVPRGSTLAFRVTSPVDGPARVFLQRRREAPEELAQVRVRAGANQLEQESGLFGVNLEDEQGAVSVWVVAHASPFDVAEALKAIASDSSPLAVGRVEVVVEP